MGGELRWEFERTRCYRFTRETISAVVGFLSGPSAEHKQCSALKRNAVRAMRKHLRGEPEPHDQVLTHHLVAYGYTTKFLLDGCNGILAGHATEKW